ncbi:MAG: beta-1,3-glucanase family protein [Candidatus Desulfacyla sp.]
MIADSGSFTAVDGDTTGNSFHLSLGNVPEEILYFTDRPAQEAGFDTVDNVINNIWPRVYGAVAPNALIKATMANQESIELFCILDDPVYDEKSGDLSFTMTYLNGNQKPEGYLSVTDAKLIILNNAATSKTEWSQVLTGDTGTFAPTDSEGVYTLMIPRVIGNVFSYASAPGRQSITLTAQAYIEDWQARFGDTPPNASIAYDANNDQDGGVQIVTLSNPVYDGQTGSISFTAKVLYGILPIGRSGLTVEGPSLFVDGGASDGLTVTLVNKSGRTAHVKFTGKPVDVDKNDVTINHGKSDTFSLLEAKSGRIYVSYDKALSSDEPDGANIADKDYHTRFDKVELSYASRAGKANLTAVDFYAIPMILETLIEGTTIEHMTLSDKMTGEKVQSALLGIMTETSLAVVKDKDEIETVRLLSPVKRPGAYPSFDAYLETLSDATLTIAGTYFGNPATQYRYTGDITANAITLKEGSDTLKIDMETLKWSKTDTQTHNGIYTCNSPYSVNGVTKAVGDNDLYAAVYRDVMTGFNLGYVKPGANDSSTWWDGSHTPFQGTYNKYAKTIADDYPGAYGFPFTDRYNHILADLGGRIDKMTITLLADTASPPPYTPKGNMNPQTGDSKFNLIIVTPDGSGFGGTPFTFNTHAYTGGNNYTFPTTKIDGSSETASQVNQVPGQNGLNIYKLEVLNKTYTVLLKVEANVVEWGSITGGASANWGDPNLFVGVN